MKRQKPSPNQPNNAGGLTRRGFLAGALAGAALAPLAKLHPISRLAENRTLLRPPFSLASEKAFLSACVRCGECMLVCPANTLQPAYLEAGAEGMMSPVLTPEINGCQDDCNVCGQVCPTNAIAPFTRGEKYSRKMGTAKLELCRCIAYTESENCNVCAKICPTQAIKSAVIDGVPKPVKIEASQCTGCGMCVTACNKIITNRSACTVTNKGKGLPTDMGTIRKNIELKISAGKDHYPLLQGN